MRKVFLALSVLALAAAAYCFWDAQRQQGNVELERQHIQQAGVELEKIAKETGRDPTWHARELEQATDSVRHAHDQIGYYLDQRNGSLYLGAGGAVIAAALFWLARRKPRVVAA